MEQMMTLLLGSPGSGKSTLLRALSGKLSSSVECTGKVIYNKNPPGPSAQHTCVYISQYDLHHAEMTVSETLDFCSHMFGTNNEFRSLGANINKLDKANNSVTCEGRVNLIVDYIIKLLGLKECAGITIGDEMRRGISGGQKKRVTIGEMLVSFARSFFMDDISNGLDSSTTFEIIRFLSQMAHLMDIAMVISLLQPPPETFELFDDIILLSEGEIVYQGPRENVLEFFEYMGFKCSERKNTADFLQEVTSKMDQAQYWTGIPREYQYIPVSKFVESFNSFHLGRLLEDKLQNPSDKNESGTVTQPKGSKTISSWNIFKSCFSREVLLFMRNYPLHIFMAMQIATMALVVMTLFLKTKTIQVSAESANKLLGSLFAGVVIVKFNGMTELQMMINRLPIFYKQRELLNLPGWALLSSIVILSIPMSIIETGIWTCLTYFSIGYAPSVIRFLQQFLAFFSMHQTSMALFRFIAAVGRTQVMANTLGTAALVAIYILGGFVVSKDNIQPWLVWGYWASPLTYAQNAVTLNEFLDERWSMPIHYEGINANTAGKVILKSRGLMVEWHWYWICVGILLGYSMIFNVLSIFALEYLNPLFKHQVNIDPRYKDAQLTEQLDKLTAREPSPKCQLVLPFKPLTLVFKHINYYVDMPAAMKKHNFNAKTLQLLRDVSGAFKPGILTALMGVTGAGKTTLLDVLSGRKTGGCIEGTITINGYPKRQETFARISGYCEQTDVHSPFITVYESLQFSAWLRLPSNIEEHQRNMFVEEVMGLVELLPLRNAIVGIPGVNGLSAEQRKRLTIAVELVSSPSIIFMDEPTSGLDARSAAIVMRAVRKTVDTGRTVVCTIHQPSIEIFEAFDELMLMKRGGQLIYSGPLGSLSCNLIQYFEAIPRCPKMKNGQNPAAWMLDVSSPAMEYTISVDYADIFQNSSVYEENMKQVEELSKRKDSNDLHFTSKYEQNLQYQFVACLWKHLKSYWKNPEHNVVRFVNTFMVALLFGLVFWQVGSKITSEQDIFNILGAVYASAMFLGFANSSIVQPYVAMERTVFYRERSSGMYSCMPYAFAQIAVEIPYTIAQVLIFSVIVYSMIGFQFTIAKFFWFTLFILLSFTYFILYGMMTVALTPTQEIAAGLSFLIFMMWNTFSGFYIPIKMIPIWWRWFYWASPPAWTIYGLMFSQLGDRVEIIRVPGYQDQTVKEFLVDYLGLQDDHIPLIVALHVVVIILFSFLFTLGIKHLNFQKR
ncbi:ABC transporter G family member 45-like isoform X2 [Asparagus officinalis]|uniref:ABC transporter G family member 45-like isoform X2 n=1 Tax=Asparagus officinalis TaxID=4686 RepID=UPI00098E0233|nr:ABC transporter G family member 45-like isoform X2 [Asparagus officinalis]